MAKRLSDDRAAANGFGRRHLHEDKDRLLYVADYTASSDMRVPGSWRLSIGRVPVPPLPFGADRWAEIARIGSSLPENSGNLTRYAPDRNKLWTAYFECRHANQLAATNRVEPRGSHNSASGRRWSASTTPLRRSPPGATAARRAVSSSSTTVMRRRRGLPTPFATAWVLQGRWRSAG
ncbi:Homeobox protein KNOX3 [Hordeum vulgare]|nr:Homeobox protein KNOX3 [Hordeum vulgare]